MENIENKEIETVEAEVVEAPITEEAPEAKKKANVLAILALVAGILGIIFCCPIGCCYYIAPVFAIAAIILAVLSPKNENGKRAGLAKAGLICGILTIVLAIVIIIGCILFPIVGTLLTDFMNEMMYY